MLTVFKPCWIAVFPCSFSEGDREPSMRYTYGMLCHVRGKRVGENFSL